MPCPRNLFPRRLHRPLHERIFLHRPIDRLFRSPVQTAHRFRHHFMQTPQRRFIQRQRHRPNAHLDRSAIALQHMSKIFVLSKHAFVVHRHPFLVATPTLFAFNRARSSRERCQSDISAPSRPQRIFRNYSPQRPQSAPLDTAATKCRPGWTPHSCCNGFAIKLRQLQSYINHLYAVAISPVQTSYFQPRRRVLRSRGISKRLRSAK